MTFRPLEWLTGGLKFLSVAVGKVVTRIGYTLKPRLAGNNANDTGFDIV
jgi:hypothetical protein